MKNLIIAVDGPAASGKGTIAKRLAAHYALPMLDTGLIYRAAGQRIADLGFDLDNPAAAQEIASAFDPAWLEDERLRMRSAGEFASRVAKHTSLRAALRKFQQDFAQQPGGAVLDGRDIGTIIAPEAAAKLWIDADVSIRAGRRYRELLSRGETVVEADILADLIARDTRDAPNMIIAEDAVRIDTSSLDVEGAVAAAMQAVREQLGH